MSDEELSEEGQAHNIDYFPVEKQQLSWKWLKFTVGPEPGKHSKHTQTDNHRHSIGVQTEESSSHKVDSDVTTPLIDQLKRYRDKYHALKESLKRLKTE